MLRLGWFSTGRGPGSRNLLKAVMDKKEQGELDIEISFVFCNWDNDEEDNPKREQRQIFFDMVEGYGIPLVTLSWKKFMPELWEKDQTAWRNEYGKELRRLTGQHPFDLGILAGAPRSGTAEPPSPTAASPSGAETTTPSGSR